MNRFVKFALCVFFAHSVYGQTVRDVNIVGTPDVPVTATQQTAIRTLLADAAPSVLPDTIVVLPTDTYTKVSRAIARGQFGSRRTNSGSDQETFGHMAGNSVIGDGFSLVALGRLYLDHRLLTHPDQLAQILFHELGHFARGPRSNEDAANTVRDHIYAPRARQSRNLWREIAQLPLTPVRETL
jgi:hypothetical protein